MTPQLIPDSPLIYNNTSDAVEAARLAAVHGLDDDAIYDEQYLEAINDFGPRG
jgi:hypothetical protein